jgi:AcrR family transcriptional regulator
MDSAPTDDQPAPRTARDRARAALMRDLLDTARRQLAVDGAASLSLRAVARELGMASSAVYRYVASRDELLTALIIETYERIAEVAEAALDEARADDLPHGHRWLAVGRAVRGWAHQHPNEWALVYGTPVAGYHAPADTIGPASRVAAVLARVAVDALAAGAAGMPDGATPLPDDLVEPSVVRLFETAGAEPGAFDDPLVVRSMTMWVGLVGLVNFELFGHLANSLVDDDTFFDAALAVAAEAIGLQVDLDLG